MGSKYILLLQNISISNLQQLQELCFFVCVFAQVEGHVVAERHTGGCECDPSIPIVFVFVFCFCVCVYVLAHLPMLKVILAERHNGGCDPGIPDNLDSQWKSSNRLQSSPLLSFTIIDGRRHI